jgi:hypothetical protein
MNRKSKALGLGLLGAAAMGAFLATGALAFTGGHFMAVKPHATVTLRQAESDKTEVTLHGLEGGIVCDESIPHYTFFLGETQSFIPMPTKDAACHTTGSATNITIAANECTYDYTVAAGTTSSTEQTMDLSCPAGKAVVISHPNCTITIPPQNTTSGLTYTNITVGGKDAVTVDSNIQLSTQYHGGICVFLGTNHTGTLKGSATLEAFDTELIRIGIVVT